MTDPISAMSTPETDIRELQKRAHDNSKAHGFHDDGDKIRRRLKHWEDRAERLGDAFSLSEREELLFWRMVYRRYLGNNVSLLHSEATEAFEHLRDGRDADEVFYEVSADGSMKPDGYPVELADLAIRIFDTAEEYGIDLAAVIALKMAYNESRPFKHGRSL